MARVPGILVTMRSDDATPAVAGEPVASERAFPSRLPAPGMGGGGSGLGAPVQLYSTDAAPFPAPADHPAGVPPVVATGPGDLRWLPRGRRGEGHGDGAA